MAVTVSVVRRSRMGNVRQIVVDITGPASYTTGGETVTAAQQAYLFPEQSPNLLTVDLTKALYFRSEVNPSTTPALLSCAIDRANNKLLFLTGGAQTTSAVDLSAQTVRALISYQLGAAG